MVLHTVSVKYASLLIVSRWQRTGMDDCITLLVRLCKSIGRVSLTLDADWLAELMLLCVPSSKSAELFS